MKVETIKEGKFFHKARYNGKPKLVVVIIKKGK